MRERVEERGGENESDRRRTSIKCKLKGRKLMKNAARAGCVKKGRKQMVIEKKCKRKVSTSTIFNCKLSAIGKKKVVVQEASVHLFLT